MHTVVDYVQRTRAAAPADACRWLRTELALGTAAARSLARDRHSATDHLQPQRRQSSSDVPARRCYSHDERPAGRLHSTLVPRSCVFFVILKKQKKNKKIKRSRARGLSLPVRARDTLRLGCVSLVKRFHAIPSKLQAGLILTTKVTRPDVVSLLVFSCRGKWRRSTLRIVDYNSGLFIYFFCGGLG